MGIVIGIFDLFAYAIPGGLYLSLLAYVLERAHWLDVPDLVKAPSIAVIAAIVVSGFIVGQATYNFAELVDRKNPFRPADPVAGARSRFAARSGVTNRAYLAVDLNVLQAAVELANREVAAEIARLRAAGLMLRNSTPPLLLASATAFVEVIPSPAKLFAGTVGVLLALMAIGCMWHSAKLRQWALTKTLELCYWIKDIDEQVTAFAHEDVEE